MGYYELDIYVESFEPYSDGFVRVPRNEVEETYAAGDLVTITDDEVLGFARVVSVDDDAASGFITLEVLAEGAADQAAEFLELVYDEWSDLLDD
jgi:hypothetical protein